MNNNMEKTLNYNKIELITQCASSVPYIFYTECLPDDVRFMPTLGNGHLGFTISDDSVYINGIYNGARGLSHRARIPNYSNITLIPEINSKSFDISYSLDVSTGIFQIQYENSEYQIIQLIYAHRFYTRAIINQIFIQRLQGKGDLKINIRQEPGQRSEDIDFSEPTMITGIEQEQISNKIIKRMMMASTSANSKEELLSTAIQSNETFYNVVDIIDENENDDDDVDQQQQFTATKKNINLNTASYLVVRDNETSAISLSSSSTTAEATATNLSIYMIQGYTKEVEDDRYQKSKKHVCCLWSHVPEEITLSEDKPSASYRFVMAVDELCSVAQQEMTDVLALSDKTILKSHRSKWIEFWNNFNISVTNNLKLSKAIYGSIFYTACSLPSLHTNQPSNDFYGISPTGLGRGGTNLDDYEGHSFWDTEIWMLPTITQMDPRWTKLLLNYRYRMLPTAKDNAKEFNKCGSKFPWESAFTGIDTVQPGYEYLSQSQLHIIADIGFALQHYFSVTYDMEWLQNEGRELSKNIAEFWASFVEKNSSGKYVIKGVMGPDEYHHNVTNNVYTNVIVGHALRFAEFARKICDNSKEQEPSNNWNYIADNLTIIYDSELDYHPQYEGYKPDIKIKQADTILIGYPLLFPMKESTRKKDLEIYEKITCNNGPAMTWSMHAVNHLDVGDYLKADNNFEKSFAHIQSPFQVWTEVNNGSGATNFLTGAGGFLQSIINGYGGIRIYLDHMEIKKPRLLPYSSAFKISGIKYLGSVFKISVDTNESVIRCKYLNAKEPLILLSGDKSYEVTINLIHHITSANIILKPKNQDFRCN